MRHQRLWLTLVVVVMLGSNIVYGQGSLGPQPKKARTLDDYKPRTFKEIIAEGLERESHDAADKIIVHGDLLPSRVRATYQGSARLLPPGKKDVLHRWAQLYAGAPTHYTVPYTAELLFSEGQRDYWLTVRKESVAQFRKQLKKGDAVDLYLIRLGGLRTGDGVERLLLVETFRQPK